MIDRYFSLPGWRFRQFWFRDIGIGVGIHDHEYEHWVVVVNGSIAIVDGAGRRQVMLSIDDPVLLKAGEPHGFDSLEAGTIIFTIVDMSQPTYDIEQDQ